MRRLEDNGGTLKSHLPEPGSTRIAFPAQPAQAPQWLSDLFCTASTQQSRLLEENTVYDITESARICFIRSRLPQAGLMDKPAFQESVAKLYRNIGSLLRARSRFPVRFWNVIPRIGEPWPRQPSRYEIFNLARFSVLTEWYGSHAVSSSLTSASGVGNRGEALEVLVLANDTPGIPIENPRQKPAYTYSARFGPVPPCFSRATLLKAPLDTTRTRISAIVSGTASVVGEDTMHREDLSSQIRETIKNLASISRSVRAGFSLPELRWDITEHDLRQFRELRVYVRSSAHVSQAIETFQSSIPALQRLEIVSTELCRHDLLVEAEGILSLEE